MIVRAIALGMALSLAASTAPEPVSTDPPEASEPPPPVVVPPPPPEPVEVDPANYKMVLAGDIVIGLGGAALVAMIVGLGIRSDALSQRKALTVAVEPDTTAIARQEQRIDTGTILAISGGAAAGALFATGITLVALGYARERKRRESLSLVPQPLVGPRTVGLHWAVRF